MQLPDITPELLERYDTRAPRYTSYPTAPQWSESFTADDYHSELQKLPAGDCEISLYVHLPFCRERCTFCGCNVVISKRTEIATDYLEWLAKEADLLLDAVPAQARLRIRQLHWGGGTPNYLTPEQMRQVHGMITDRFELLPDAEIALEMDPRHVSQEHIDTLAALGFNRVSLGLQDTDPRVQEAVNRVHSRDTVEQVIAALRAAGFKGLNLDLIYGLPFQTLESWQQTLRDMERFQPDRVAMYGFAYIPSKMKQQKHLQPDSLPDSRQRFEQFLSGLDWFTSHDYLYIGLDHFALKTDELAVACCNQTLQRNFMGYTTLAGAHLLALGSSSISNLKNCFIQNDSHLAGYKRAVLAGRLPVSRGMKLNDDDLLRCRIIHDLMCFHQVRMDLIEEEFKIDFASYFLDELERLRIMEDDGLVQTDGHTIQTTLLGSILLRNVAAVFDAYFKPGAERSGSVVYSKTI